MVLPALMASLFDEPLTPGESADTRLAALTADAAESAAAFPAGPNQCPLCGDRFVSAVWLSSLTGQRTWACSNRDCGNAFGVTVGGADAESEASA